MSDTVINSVWSSYGHRFMSDGEGTESCLTCGAVYEVRATPDASYDGNYFAADGSEPMKCSRDTSMVHGYSGKRDESAGDTDHACNCLLCNS